MFRPRVTKVYIWSFLLIVAISVATANRNGTTLTPTNVTTLANNATTPTPTNATTPASIATTPTPTNATTSASNATTPTPTNATTPASNATTVAPTNATTPASNATTPTPANTTTPASNTTTATPTNTTTPASNATTPSSNTTGTTVAPTSAPVARWAINDKNGTLCMLMNFNGTLTLTQGKDKIFTDIPASNDVGKSTCNNKTAKFVLEFISKGGIWQLILNFTRRGNSYELHETAVNVYATSGAPISSAYLETTFFTVPIGRYYSCDWFNQSVSPFEVNLTKPIFQPFVQQTASHRDLGDVHQCGSGAGGPNISLVVGIILGIIVVVAAVVAVYFLVKRSKASASPPYAALS